MVLTSRNSPSNGGHIIEAYCAISWFKKCFLMLLFKEQEVKNLNHKLSRFLEAYSLVKERYGINRYDVIKTVRELHTKCWWCSGTRSWHEGLGRMVVIRKEKFELGPEATLFLKNLFLYNLISL